jgi:hypothetical protein
MARLLKKKNVRIMVQKKNHTKYLHGFVKSPFMAKNSLDEQL